MPLEEPGIRLFPTEPVKKAMAVTAGLSMVANATNVLPTQPSFQPVKLDVPRFLQEGPEWCWAACIAMVRAFYQAPLDQCIIVKNQFPTANPCNETIDQRTEGCNPREIKSAWEVNGFNPVKPSSGPLLPRMEDIKSDLKAGTPLQAGIAYFGGNGSGHVVIIEGWSDTVPESLHINDSLKQSLFYPEVSGGQGLVTLDELRGASGFGIWAYAWRNLSLAT